MGNGCIVGEGRRKLKFCAYVEKLSNDPALSTSGYAPGPCCNSREGEKLDVEGKIDASADENLSVKQFNEIKSIAGSSST
ncbi:hypothetical protein KSX_63730 [Ktedonospora formicarum]|uniref:Uncharacterized protein n=1 Tax=Ktedonospora formicarum TaxID=2778364 RepID=A0A8J3I7D2_9CHLR|nr:hypothetical protein KSX_63730 [Ktedonospora formicarum]